VWSGGYDVAVLLDRLLSDLELTLRPFAVCEIASGWRLRLGRVDWVTVHFVVSGSGRLRASDGAATALRRHTLALVPASHAHQLEFGDPVEHEATASHPQLRADDLDVYEAGPRESDELRIVCGRLQARPARGPGLFDNLQAPLVIDFADSADMVHVFERLLDEERQATTTSAAMMTALMNEALILLFRRLCADPECPLPWLSAFEDPRLAEPLTLMLEHPERAHSLESLAEAASMSRTTFAQAFKSGHGQSPMVYLRETRLRRAAGLLQGTDQTVDQVAASVGYSSRSQFSKAFTSHFGVTPAAFRAAPVG